MVGGKNTVIGMSIALILYRHLSPGGLQRWVYEVAALCMQMGQAELVARREKRKLIVLFIWFWLLGGCAEGEKE